MKLEKEFSLLIDLYLCPAKNRNSAWCKSEFEKYLGYGQRNKDFRDWLDSLIENNCLIYVGEKPKGLGKLVPVYNVDKSKVHEILEENPLWKKVYDIYLLIKVK